MINGFSELNLCKKKMFLFKVYLGSQYIIEMQIGDYDCIKKLIRKNCIMIHLYSHTISHDRFVVFF